MTIPGSFVQLGSPIGDGVLVESREKEHISTKINDYEGTGNPLPDVYYQATKSTASLRDALRSIEGLTNGYYTEKIMDSMTKNDMIFTLKHYAEDLVAAKESIIPNPAANSVVKRGNLVRWSGEAGLFQSLETFTVPDPAPSAVGIGNNSSVGDTVTWADAKLYRIQ